LKVGTNNLSLVAKKKVTVATTSVSSTEGLALQLEAEAASI
jgi:hypothetical protein